MPALVVLLIISAFLIGMLLTKVYYLEKGFGGNGTTTTGNQTAATPAPTVDISTIKGLFNDKNIHFGDANAKNLLVEVADPSCPYCHIAAGQDPEVAKAYGQNFVYQSEGGTYVPPVTEMKKLVDSGDAAFVWIYSPGHGNGEMGTRALYCANEQGKFWEVHDVLMSEKGYEIQNGYDANGTNVSGTVVGNDKTKTQDLVNFIGNVADGQKLADCINSGKYDDRLSSDAQIATSLGVSGTPGFFVNENKIDGADTWDNMKGFLK